MELQAMKTICKAVLLIIQTLQCLATDDSPFQLTDNVSGFCLVKTNNRCNDIRWTSGDRLLVQQMKKCLGVQGKSVGSEISLYDCDENSELQKWECRNETVLALKGQELHIKLTADNTAVLSKTVRPNNHLTISGTPSGACTRTYRELYTIGGNAAGMPCMFPFLYKDQWFTDCTTVDSAERIAWCAVETKFQSERWGYCPITSKENWNKHPTTGAYYQLNTQSALTWPQAETSCKQQGASLLSITDPHQQAYITALLGTKGNKFWTGMILDPGHGWKWSNGRPYRYMNWDSGYPLSNPGHNCVIIDPAAQYLWQNSPCSQKLGYICYSKAADDLLTQVVETGFCSSPWIRYNGHCFHLNRTQKTWSSAQGQCRNLGGDLVSIHNVEHQSFVISQLGYASTDELWIGLNDRKTEGLFEWIDHSAVSFTRWEFGKPDVTSEVKDCILIRGQNGNWADRMCEEKHGFICMKMSASKPTGEEVLQDVGCKPGWRRQGSYCYLIGTQAKTFNEADADCKSYNSYLADVSTGVDNAFLVSLVGMRPEKHFWIGLSNQKNIGNFAWTNTDSVKFTNWNSLMPGHHKGCVGMTTGIFAGLWDVLPCTTTLKYICKHLAEGAVLTTVPPTLGPTKCTERWQGIYARDYCFKVFGQSVSWYEARDYCRAIGGDLLSIHSAAEAKLLRGLDAVWIGLSAPDPAVGYVWSDGSPVQYQQWGDGQPDNTNNMESCVEMRMSKRNFVYFWNDMHCEKSNRFICQIRRGLTPKQPPGKVIPVYNRTSDGWLEWKGNQYYFNYVLLPMEQARTYCQQLHGDLITINSEAESIFLWKRMSRIQTFFWIGLTVDLDKTSVWIDGSPLVFQIWDRNQPRFLNNDEHCAVINQYTGFWHNYNCGLQFSSICKRSQSPPVTATVAPTIPLRGGCPPNWKTLGTQCFNVVNNQNETWEEARTRCKAMGGNLASILTREKQVFLTLAMIEAPTTDLWIGLMSVNRFPFYWTDGQPMVFTNWAQQWSRYPPIRFYDDYTQMDDMVPVQVTKKECAVMTTNPNIGLGKWVKKSCNDTAGYVCLRNVDPSFPDSPTPTITNYVTIFNDSFKAVRQQMTWNAAKRYCEADGAKLASLRNNWSVVYSEFIALNLSTGLWIGLNTEETGGYYRFIDGWRLTTTNWDRGQPRRQPQLDCVYVDMNGKWNTADCDQKRAFVCMKSSEVPPTESTLFPGFCPELQITRTHSFQSYSFIPFKGYCYLFVTDRVDWSTASVDCTRHGAALVSIEDPSEQDFIASNLKVYQDSQSSFWIGLYKTHSGKFQWLDKTVLDYTNLEYYQAYDMDFVGIQTENGKWRAAQRRSNRGYICKTPKILPPTLTTTVNPTMIPRGSGHITLAVALVITAITVAAVIVVVIIKKPRCCLTLLEKSSTFDNPLFLNNEQSQANLVENQGSGSIYAEREA